MGTDDRTALAADQAGASLLKALLDEIRLLPRPWMHLPEAEQADTIERLRNRVRAEIGAVAQAIVSAGHVAMQAKLDAIGFRDGLRITLSATRDSAGRHDLIDSLGIDVTLVLGNAEQFLGGMGEIKATPDQNRLDLEVTADDVIARAMKKDDLPPPFELPNVKQFIASIAPPLEPPPPTEPDPPSTAGWARGKKRTKPTPPPKTKHKRRAP